MYANREGSHTVTAVLVRPAYKSPYPLYRHRVHMRTLHSAGKLVDALGESEAIRLPRGSVFDLTGYDLPGLGDGGRLVSGGERDDGPTATLVTNAIKDGRVLTARENYHWEGVAFHGPEHDRVPLDRGAECIGVGFFGERAHVERAEFSGFPCANLQFGAFNPWRETQATMRDVYSHHSLMDGYGYGAEVNNGHLLVEGCRFDWCRHHLTSDGRPTTHYTVRGSDFGRQTVYNVLDVHGRERDGAPPVAGGRTIIGPGNRIRATGGLGETKDTRGVPQEAVKIRGIPAEVCIVIDNDFAHDGPPDAPGDNGEAVYQEYADGEWQNVYLSGNRYGVR